MTTLASVRDCDRELDRISREQAEAIRAKAYLKRRKKSVSDQRLALQQRDFFRVTAFEQMREAAR
jgi:hypothetical protein